LHGKKRQKVNKNLLILLKKIRNSQSLKEDFKKCPKRCKLLIIEGKLKSLKKTLILKSLLKNNHKKIEIKLLKKNILNPLEVEFPANKLIRSLTIISQLIKSKVS
jgi:hypothetical protein